MFFNISNKKSCNIVSSGFSILEKILDNYTKQNNTKTKKQQTKEAGKEKF
jgi:hypothetical protein